MNRQSDVIENWEYGLLTLLNNALNLPVSEKNDAIEVKSIIEDVSRKLDSDSIQKFNEYSEDEWTRTAFYHVQCARRRIETESGSGQNPYSTGTWYCQWFLRPERA